MKAFQRILAVLLCLVMSLGMISMVASAETAIDTTATGTLHIHKFVNGTPGDPGDGTVITDTSSLGDGLAGVKFTAYMVKDAAATVAYYNGTGEEESVTVNTYLNQDGSFNTSKLVPTSATVTKNTFESTETDESGNATIANLPVGMYVVVETQAPAKVTDRTPAFLVSIPMTDPDTESAWMYDVHVYPKNSTSVGAVKLVKKGEGATEYLVATFSLEKKDANGDWQTYETATVTTSATQNGTTIANLEHGDYKLTETNVVAEGYIVNASPIYFTVNNNNTVTYDSTNTTHAKVTPANSGTATLTLTVENEKPDVTKTDVSTNKTPGVGGTVNFEVTVEVPTNVAAMQSFTLTDAPTNLTVDENSIVVKEGDTTLTKGTHYTVTENNANIDGFVITFVVSKMGDFAGDTLIVTYNATVKDEAATEGMTTNDVTLNYNDGVRAMTDTDDTEDQKYYKIDITKRKDSTTGAVAAGVEFKLYKDADMTQEVKVTGETGEYVYNPNGAANDDATLTTDENGKLVVSGLPAGTYYLKETKAPEGYNLLSDKITITLGESTANQTHTQTIVNKAGFTLPQTGGIGTLMFIIIGGVLMAGGICLIVPNKKRAI